jgi:hypothetical protein
LYRAEYCPLPVHGAWRAAHLNGSLGRVVQLVQDTGRWRVQLLDGEGREVVEDRMKKMVNIKLANVKLQSPKAVFLRAKQYQQ